MSQKAARALTDYAMSACHCRTAEYKASARAEGRVRDDLYVPVAQGDGIYFLDLDTVMCSESAPTSKEVLIPFLQKENYKKLEVKCSHIPPWFYRELPALKTSALAEKKEDCYLITLIPENK